MLRELPIDVDHDRVARFCERWRVAELALFGSVLREDFHDGSDVDVLVRFPDGYEWRLADLDRMEEELGLILGREVDLVEGSSVDDSPNYIRRRAVLNSLETLYVAR